VVSVTDRCGRIPGFLDRFFPEDSEINCSESIPLSVCSCYCLIGSLTDLVKGHSVTYISLVTFALKMITQRGRDE
jgi:hypothetical protein